MRTCRARAWLMWAQAQDFPGLPLALVQPATAFHADRFGSRRNCASWTMLRSLRAFGNVTTVHARSEDFPQVVFLRRTRPSAPCWRAPSSRWTCWCELVAAAVRTARPAFSHSKVRAREEEIAALWSQRLEALIRHDRSRRAGTGRYAQARDAACATARCRLARMKKHHRRRQPEGRSRQDHHGRQPRRLARGPRVVACCWWTSIRRAMPRWAAASTRTRCSSGGRQRAHRRVRSFARRSSHCRMCAGMSLLPSNQDVTAAEVQPADDGSAGRELRTACTALAGDRRSHYDIILIDCPPALKHADC